MTQSVTYSQFDFRRVRPGGTTSLHEENPGDQNSTEVQSMETPFMVDQTYATLGPCVEMGTRFTLKAIRVELGGFGGYLINGAQKKFLYGVEFGLGLRLR